jgi:hypothetical protein
MTPKQRARAFTRQCANNIQREINVLDRQSRLNRGKPILPDRGNYFKADWLVEYDENDRGPPASAPPCRGNGIT